MFCIDEYIFIIACVHLQDTYILYMYVHQCTCAHIEYAVYRQQRTEECSYTWSTQGSKY